MKMKEFCEHLVLVTNPSRVFGIGSDKTAIKKNYLAIVRKIHPDIVESDEKIVASEATAHLNKLYKSACEQIDKGTYGEEIENISHKSTSSYTQENENFENEEPIFKLNIKGKIVKIYNQIFEGKICDVYVGLLDDKKVFLKAGKIEESDELLQNEYQILSRVKHRSLPSVLEMIKINCNLALLENECVGQPLSEILKKLNHGISQNHVMWILERLLEVTGFLHSNMIVHGNIKPETIILDTKNHNASLVGLYFGCDKSVGVENYKVKNKIYSAPEISKLEEVNPRSDIFSIGKIAISLLNGNEISKVCPSSTNRELANFIEKMAKQDSCSRPYDAFKLWDELREVRTKIVGNKRFEEFVI
ncbi:MAG: protein kinase [Clostridia bacterium]